MFSAAVKQLLKREGRGEQVVLAQRLGVTSIKVSPVWPAPMPQKICPAKKLT
jgi:hypothetical protein